MKILISFAFVLVCISASGQQNGDRVERKEDGTTIVYSKGIKIAEGKVENNRKDGKWVYYDTVGRITAEIYFDIGVLDGKATYYNPETKIKYAEGTHKNNKRKGEWRFYYQGDGKIKAIEEYDGMILNGTAQYFDSTTSKLYLEMPYKNGIVDGVTKYYDPITGYLVSELTLKNRVSDGASKFYFNDARKMLKLTAFDKNDIGNGRSTYYDSISGKPIHEIDIKNGLFDGESKQYDYQGNLFTLSHYKEGKQNGYMLCMDTLTQNKKHEGYWDMEKRDGQWKYYNSENGKLIVVENFKDDLLHGELIIYDSITGRKVREGTYRNNIRTGKWLYYAALTGSVVAEENIKNNDEKSELILYNINKKKVAVVNYQNGMKNGKGYYYYPNSDVARFEYNSKNDSIDGELIVRYPSGKIKRREVYNSGVFISGKCYDESGNEIEFTPIRVKAGYRDDIMTYLGDNIQYPENAKRLGIEGKVIVRFVVNKNGRISDVEVVKNLNKECDDEAIRVISQMPPWEPARIDDEALETYETLPIVFWIH